MRKPTQQVWLTADELEWLLATLLVHGDPLQLRKTFDEARRTLADVKIQRQKALEELIKVLS